MPCQCQSLHFENLRLCTLLLIGYKFSTIWVLSAAFWIFLATTKMDSLTTGSLSGVQKEELMDQVKQQIAIANAQELLTKMSEKCFKKCISKPGTSLDNSEQKCIAMCMDRYMDAWNLVSRTYSTRIQRERNNMWGSHFF